MFCKTLMATRQQRRCCTVFNCNPHTNVHISAKAITSLRFTLSLVSQVCFCSSLFELWTDREKIRIRCMHMDTLSTTVQFIQFRATATIRQKQIMQDTCSKMGLKNQKYTIGFWPVFMLCNRRSFQKIIILMKVLISYISCVSQHSSIQ